MNNLTVIEHEQQRVLLTSQLAAGYGTSDARIHQAYLRNKERFEYGKHYYELEGEALRHFKANYQNDSNLKYVSKLMLWTEKGALHHAKIINTDQAWGVYEVLEDAYFRVKTLPQTYEEMIIMQAKSMQEFKTDVDYRFKVMDQKVDNQITLDHGLQRKIQKAVGKRVYELLGEGTDEYKRYSKKYFAAIYRDIKNRMGIPSYKDVKKKDYQAVTNYIKYWMPPSNIKESV
ncbi:ORF6C domain-containing protein [Vallitalea pronyensis]|uniref:ORF6C domain-containing protein n=1 Tax=Vallitalea pronyensis TaxID=1348613 RepID=A0A8J8MN02_9FIRM|nr:ORF6N domain-containing protein [Vallitalea pronyensis]QUI24902.1 ORF6C domain-containing protein [Vallitalea pronyensis]